MMACLLLLTSANYWAFGFAREKRGSAASIPVTAEKGTDKTPSVPNPTEEKAPGGLQNLSEYLHDGHHPLEHPLAGLPLHNGQGFMVLPVHHPELLTPPPRFAA